MSYLRKLLTPILLLWAVCAGRPVSAQTLDTILARHIQARGGAANLSALRTLRITGKASFGGDEPIELAWARFYKRGGAVRTELTLQGLTAVDVTDGQDGWTLQPFGGRREPERASADDAKIMAHDADIEGPLFRWREKGHRLDYLGTEDIDGTAAHKLRLVRKDGDTLYVYLDPDAFLIIREEHHDHIRGTERISEVDLGNYAPVAGVMFPFSLEMGGKGEPRSARFTIERAEANVDLDDAHLRFPAAGQPILRAIFAGSGPGPAASPVPAARLAEPALSATPPPFDAGVLSGLRARNIGAAAMSGRIAAVAACKQDGKTTVYVGAASGGVWRSRDGGTTFKPVFDKQPVQSIGAIAVDPSHPRTVWVGTGESWMRNSVSIGDGIYRSDDEGETWTHLGLPSSEHIARILVHPKDSRVVYACVPGKLWSDSADRGLYRTADGGKTWTLVLTGKNLSTGCASLAMDPQNPSVLFAGLWDFRRQGWTFRSGGDGPDAPSGSGLWRSADGGTTWAPLTARTRKGLPPGPWGRSEVTIAPSDPRVVYAFIESKDSALYRSADGGQTWEARDKSQGMTWRPFYFARLVVDPTRPDRLFKPDGALVVSEDGGRSFSYSGGGSHGDWHDLWIDPQDPQHVIGGDDGGLWISHDGGSRWWKADNLPISQFYHVSVDARDPYQVYGGLQDNSSWVGESSYPGGITSSRWENLYGGDGFWTVPDATDPDAVYAESQGGFIGRVNRKTHASRDIQPKAGYKEKLRFNWNTPIHASPTQKGTIYIGAQFLFRSRDRGDSWERISPDLSSNDPEKQKQEQSGGVTVDNSAAEMHTSIYAIAESPLRAGVIWVGTDDGNLQLTRDGGKSWQNVVGNVPELPRASWVSWVEPSRFDVATAYAAFDRHTFGDMSPWVYKTSDFGKTWTRIAGAQSGVRGYVHTIREDLVNRSLLFLGSEFGLWISLDGGAAWAAFTGGDFPAVAVREVQVHPREHDLIIATHGRGIWIIDDLTPLRALAPRTLAEPVAFLPGRPVQQRLPAQGGWANGDAAFAGENPPGGAMIAYYQRSRPLIGPAKLEVLDGRGQVVDTLTACKRRGLCRVSWSMRLPPPRVPRAAQVAGSSAQGPRVLPGPYTVRLTRGAQVYTTPLLVALDRRAPFGVAERKAQLDAVLRARSLFGEMSALVDRLDAARRVVAELVKTLPVSDALGGRVRALGERLDEVKKKVVATKEGGSITGEERIREHLDFLYGALNGWEGRPARYQVERLDVLRRELSDVVKEFDALAAQEIAPLNKDQLGPRKLELVPTMADPHAEEEPEVDDDRMAAALRCLRSGGGACEPAATTRAAERDAR